MKLNLLASYFYLHRAPEFTKTLLALAPYVDILIDSGAHSGETLGVTINHKSYIDFVRMTQDAFWGHIQLDLIGNRTVTAANFGREVAAGVKTIPVITVDEDEKRILDLLPHSKRVCVAGGVRENSIMYSARIERIWRYAEGKCWIHGLGYTRPQTLQSRVLSCDSSSWRHAGRSGVIYTYDPWKPFQGRRKHHRMATSFVRDKIHPSHYWTEHGNVGELSLLQVGSALSWLKVMRDFWQQGVKLFLALASRHALFSLVAALAVLDQYDLGQASLNGKFQMSKWKGMDLQMEAIKHLRRLNWLDDDLHKNIHAPKGNPLLAQRA